MFDDQPDRRPPRHHTGPPPGPPVRVLALLAAATVMTLLSGACGLASASEDLEAAPAPFSSDSGQDADGSGNDGDNGNGNQEQATAQGAEARAQNQAGQAAAQNDDGATTTTSEPDELPDPTPVPSEQDKTSLQYEDQAEQGPVQGEMEGNPTESTTKDDDECHGDGTSSGDDHHKVAGDDAIADKDEGCRGDRLDPADDHIDESCGTADCSGYEPDLDTPPDPCPDGSTSRDNCDPADGDGTGTDDQQSSDAKMLPEDELPLESDEPGYDAEVPGLDESPLKDADPTAGGLGPPEE